MCGLFGIASRSALADADIHRAEEARISLRHRGPDNGSHWTDHFVYMGHQRLSIIDTSATGNQPMTAGGVIISVNGEIYNFKSLKLELEAAGYKFFSKSDSEVVLHGYLHWGIDGLAERLDGMYALVIYDTNRKILYALRDRTGIKPLYYYLDKDTFAWASELKALVKYFGKDRLEIDNSAIIDYLACKRIPAPKSLYKNVFKLLPAHKLIHDLASGSLSTHAYWRLSTSEVQASDEELATRLLALLRESVYEQLVSDVPVGLLLSGGIDSSAVAVMASEKVHLHSFSIGFSNPKRDETPYAMQIAAQTGMKHHSYRLTDAEMDNLADHMATLYDEPLVDSSTVATYRVAKIAREQVTVALSGDGGDELFGGYKWYRWFDLIGRWQRLWPIKVKYGFSLPLRSAPARLFGLLTIKDPVILYARLRGSLAHHRLQWWKKRLGVPLDYDPYWSYRMHYRPELAWRKAAQYIDFHTYLPDDILTKVDRTSMAVSLECRPPFLSRKLIEFAFSLPESFLYRGGALKGGLKYALRELLPENILTRKKQGFSVPDTGWRQLLINRSGSVQENLLLPFLDVHVQSGADQAI